MNAFKIILVSIFAVILFSNCEKEVETKFAELYGSWIKTVIDVEGAAFTAELQIHENNSYDFIILVNNANNHTDSFAEFDLDGQTMTITNDTDCESDGVYDLIVENNILIITLVSDDCIPRALALKGNWQKSN